MYSNRGSGCGIAFERLFLTPEIRNSNSVHQTFSEHFSTRMEKIKNQEKQKEKTSEEALNNQKTKELNKRKNMKTYQNCKKSNQM